MQIKLLKEKHQTYIMKHRKGCSKGSTKNDSMLFIQLKKGINCILFEKRKQ